MNRHAIYAAAAMIALGAVAPALAQPFGDQRRGEEFEHRGEDRHDDRRDDRREGGHEWHRGDRMAREDWDRGRRFDYREHHLSPPPRGYEWREIDGRYVLAAVATGVIAEIILNSVR